MARSFFSMVCHYSQGPCRFATARGAGCDVQHLSGVDVSGIVQRGNQSSKEVASYGVVCLVAARVLLVHLARGIRRVVERSVTWPVT